MHDQYEDLPVTVAVAEDLSGRSGVHKPLGTRTRQFIASVICNRIAGIPGPHLSTRSTLPAPCSLPTLHTRSHRSLDG